jgi:hypothetical protein
MDKMLSYEFVFTMHLLKNIMGITNELSQALQRKDQDIVNAMGLVEVVKEQLQEFRERDWDIFLEEVNTFCVDNCVSVPNMEDIVLTRSRKRHGGQTITYFHFFRVEVFCQVIDLISQELDNRFTEAGTELLLCLACLDPKNSFSAFDHAKLLRLAELYPEDFRADDKLILKNQLNTYIRDVRRNVAFSGLQDIRSLAMKMVETKKNNLFPLVYRLVELALILPVATATVERAFSAMNIIKSDLRNSMGDEWMNDCMVVYIEHDVFMDIENEAVLQHFQKMQNRRMQLSPLSRST